MVCMQARCMFSITLSQSLSLRVEPCFSILLEHYMSPIAVMQVGLKLEEAPLTEKDHNTHGHCITLSPSKSGESHTGRACTTRIAKRTTSPGRRCMREEPEPLMAPSKSSLHLFFLGHFLPSHPVCLPSPLHAKFLTDFKRGNMAAKSPRILFWEHSAKTWSWLGLDFSSCFGDRISGSTTNTHPPNIELQFIIVLLGSQTVLTAWLSG